VGRGADKKTADEAINTTASPSTLSERDLGLVRAIAIRVKQGLPPTIELDELVAYGTQGLLEATQRFDAGRGASFSTFAYYRIRGAIYDGLRQMGWLSRGEYARHRAMERVNDYLGEAAARDTNRKLPETPGSDGVEEKLGVIADTLDAVATIFVISTGAEAALDIEDRETPLADVALAHHESLHRVRQALPRLPERERRLVELVYFGEATLQDAGKELGMSKSWACRLHARAVELLRQLLEEPEGTFSAQPLGDTADSQVRR
jgi:RNA polymerase sigma factor for flagellar operon FliA